MATDGQTLSFPYRLSPTRSLTLVGICAAAGLIAAHAGAQDGGLSIGRTVKLSPDVMSWFWLYAAALAFAGSAFFLFAMVATYVVRQRLTLTDYGILAPAGLFNKDPILVNYNQITSLAVSGYGMHQSLTINWSGSALEIKNIMLPGVTSFDLIHRRLASEIAEQKRSAEVPQLQAA